MSCFLEKFCITCSPNDDVNNSMVSCEYSNYKTYFNVMNCRQSNNVMIVYSDKFDIYQDAYICGVKDGVILKAPS